MPAVTTHKPKQKRLTKTLESTKWLMNHNNINQLIQSDFPCEKNVIAKLAFRITPNS